MKSTIYAAGATWLNTCSHFSSFVANGHYLSPVSWIARRNKQMASPALVPLVYANGCASHTYSPLGILPPSTSCSFSSSSFASSLSSSRSHAFLDSCNFPGINTNWRNRPFELHATSTAAGNSSSMDVLNTKTTPDHLLVLVHGILASPDDWTYFQAELKRRLGSNFLIYASSSNVYTKTFKGVDGAGRRLAEEVMDVVKKTGSLKKISFLSHSLGGLFARYAVAVLYTGNEESGSGPHDIANASRIPLHGSIAGLEPISFITLATPHLGVRGRKQLPFLLGVPMFEKLAPPLAAILIGRTGGQLFLTDGKSNGPPLLLRMATDCDDGKFISALGAFKCRILYANVSYDHMVGWRTSSVRRENELPKPPESFLDGYKHLVNLEYCPPVLFEGPHLHPKAEKAKEAAQGLPSTVDTAEYHEIMEEEMIRGLQRLGWKKVDVSFRSATWPFFAHNNIHVKNELLHNSGAGVVAHVADSLQQQESSAHLSAIL